MPQCVLSPERKCFIKQWIHRSLVEVSLMAYGITVKSVSSLSIWHQTGNIYRHTVWLCQRRASEEKRRHWPTGTHWTHMHSPKWWHFETVDKWRKEHDFEQCQRKWTAICLKQCDAQWGRRQANQDVGQLVALPRQTFMRHWQRSSFPWLIRARKTNTVEHGRRKLININASKKQAQSQLIDDWSFHSIRSFHSWTERVHCLRIAYLSVASAHTAAKWEQNITWKEETPFYD